MNLAARVDKDRHPRAWLLVAMLVLCLAPALIGAAAQKKAPQDEGGDKEGLFLVAHRELGDPLFARSAVLMLPIEKAPVVVGLIINKPTHVSLHDLFPDSPAPRKDNATAYFGGPVDIHDRSAIFRSPTPPKDALHVFADVYVNFDSDAIAAMVKNSLQASTMHVLLGRAQWGHVQLQNEILAGAWYSMRVNADPIFNSHPAEVWQILLDRVEPRPEVDYRPSASPSELVASML